MKTGSRVRKNGREGLEMNKEILKALDDIRFILMCALLIQCAGSCASAIIAISVSK